MAQPSHDPSEPYRRSGAPAAIDGAVSGGIATLAMSAWMLIAGVIGMTGEQPPKKITREAVSAVSGRAPSDTASTLLAPLAHLAFGAAAGALFGAVHRGSAPDGRRLTLRGILFGLGIWAVSYGGWIPALGILPPPERDRPGRPTSMIAAHVIWGATLGAITHRGVCSTLGRVDSSTDSATSSASHHSASKTAPAYAKRL